jgi:hypothetical protein
LITERDNRIVREWFEPYHYATIMQIEKAFFRDQQYSYEVARKRLIELGKADLIKIYHDSATNRNIYMLKSDKIKPPSYHRIVTLDILAEMMYCGFNIEQYEIEKAWLDGKIKSDAYVVFVLRNMRYRFFVEVQTANNWHRLEKYDTLYDSGEVQKSIGKYPRILFVSDYSYKDLHIKSTEIVQLNTKLNKFPSILL